MTKTSNSFNGSYSKEYVDMQVKFAKAEEQNRILEIIKKQPIEDKYGEFKSAYVLRELITKIKSEDKKE